MKRSEILDKYLTKRSSYLKRVLSVLIGLIIFSLIFIFIYEEKEYIAKVSIEGIISNPIKTLDSLEKIEKSSSAKALIVTVNSPGGTFVSSKELYDQIKKISIKIPVVTYMREMATSGGYMVSLGSQKIYSNTGTITGSIGVILQTAEFTTLFDKLGINPIVIKSGKLKATPNPLETLSTDDSEYLGEVINSMQAEFLEILTKNRNIENFVLEKISDGRIFTGRQAKNLNLIDMLGTEKDAVEWLKKEAKLSDDVEIKNFSKENKYDELINLNFLKNKLNFFKNNFYNGFLAIWVPTV